MARIKNIPSNARTAKTTSSKRSQIPKASKKSTESQTRKTNPVVSLKRSSDSPKTGPAKNTCSKKQKAHLDSDEDEPDVPENEKEWPVRRILAQQGEKYLLEWDDNPRTGETYKPTWEPRSNVGKGLIDEWETQKELEAEAEETEDSDNGA